jgi:hypothetical protein
MRDIMRGEFAQEARRSTISFMCLFMPGYILMTLAKENHIGYSYN